MEYKDKERKEAVGRCEKTERYIAKVESLCALMEEYKIDTFIDDKMKIKRESS